MEYSPSPGFTVDSKKKRALPEPKKSSGGLSPADLGQVNRPSRGSGSPGTSYPSDYRTATICPRCKTQPRRRPGDLCLECFNTERALVRRTSRHVKNDPESVCKVPQAPRRFFRPLDAKRYIITAAQNATPVHAGFLKSLQTAASALKAELVVIPLRYKNPTSRWTASQQNEEQWAPELEPYLYNERKKLNSNLVLVGDVKTQPTASAPLTGFESLTGGESCIFGHTKIQLRAVPVPTGRFPKILTTTGACTLPNFTDSKAGALGAFHHSFGAVIVEIEGKTFHLRQINADKTDGSFTDLDKHYTAKYTVAAPPALALVMGDTHVRFTCPKVDAATFGPAGIVETLNPQTLVFHDVLDGDTVNPHQVGDPFLAEAKRRAGKTDIQAEIQEAVTFVGIRAKGRRAVIVDSNHHDFLCRWINRTDWRQDLKNAAFYLETAQVLLKSATLTPHGGEYTNPFQYWVKKLGGSGIRCLGPDESFKLAGIECGMHGHRGPNGARGSLKNLSRLGSRVISGHTHTPGIEEGHYQCGTSTPLRLEYTLGPSSWLNCHTVLYASGKRSLITVIDGSWRARG